MLFDRSRCVGVSRGVRRLFFDAKTLEQRVVVSFAEVIWAVLSLIPRQ